MQQLTAREREVSQMILQGLAIKEMASALNLSLQGVRFHISNILRKSEASSRMELLGRAIRTQERWGRAESEGNRR